jgi:hypothetical protein
MAILAMPGHGRDALATFLRPQSFALRNPSCVVARGYPMHYGVTVAE